MSEMRSDADLLNTLCDEAPVVIDMVTGVAVAINRKQLAQWTGVSIQTVSDYGTGKYNIPLDFWARALAHHFDARIPGMLFAHCGYPVTYGMCRVPPAPGERGFFKSAVEESGAYHETQKQIAELLADGRIDELDERTIEKYDDAHCRFISLSGASTAPSCAAIARPFPKGAARDHLVDCDRGIPGWGVRGRGHLERTFVSLRPGLMPLWGRLSLRFRRRTPGGLNQRLLDESMPQLQPAEKEPHVNDWIFNIVWLLAGALVSAMIWATMNGFRVDASCRCGKVQIHGPVASTDVSGLVERLERSCPTCRIHYEAQWLASRAADSSLRSPACCCSESRS